MKPGLEKGNGNKVEKIGGGKLLMSSGKGNENGKRRLLQGSGNWPENGFSGNNDSGGSLGSV